MPSTTFENLNLQKKEIITNALLTEFSQHSLASAQVARIVKKAGIARGAFYKYFTDLTEAYQYLYQVAILEIHTPITRANHILAASDYVNQIKAGYYTTDFNGEKLEITSDMITTTLKNKEGYKSATNGNISVVLETTLTDDLLLEGLAREVVRKVQSLRKEADFIITDRITLYYNGNDLLDKMIATYEEYVKEETLSIELIKDENLPKDIMLNDIAMALKVEKVK